MAHAKCVVQIQHYDGLSGVEEASLPHDFPSHFALTLTAEDWRGWLANKGAGYAKTYEIAETVLARMVHP